VLYIFSFSDIMYVINRRLHKFKKGKISIEFNFQNALRTTKHTVNDKFNIISSLEEALN